MKKAIFWDSDGTLLYGNESFKISLIRSFEKFGYSLEEDVARNFMREYVHGTYLRKTIPIKMEKNGGRI